MGRAPCCEKMGLKKGPWTGEEDLILVNYITHNGHDNWRALPKRAGLLRCGKSCRLRWMNYLRPDIKRGNFTPQEEETIINLHHELGNRWSVIAARLPGRTDNEIKNIWHTHLKKRLNKQSGTGPEPEPEPKPEPEPETTTESSDVDTNSEPNSPLHASSSEATSSSAAAEADTSPENAAEMDESFWSEVLYGDDSTSTHFSTPKYDSLFQFSYPFGSDSSVDSSMDFWCNLFNRAEDQLVQLS